MNKNQIVYEYVRNCGKTKQVAFTNAKTTCLLIVNNLIPLISLSVQSPSGHRTVVRHKRGLPHSRWQDISS